MISLRSLAMIILRSWPCKISNQSRIDFIYRCLGLDTKMAEGDDDTQIMYYRLS